MLVSSFGGLGAGASALAAEAILPSVLTKELTASDGNTYLVTVSYDIPVTDPEADPLELLNDNVELQVSEIADGADPAYDAYVEKSAETIGEKKKNLAYVKALDISLRDMLTGEEFRPEGGARVSIQLLNVDAMQDMQFSVIHFIPEEEPEEEQQPEGQQPEGQQPEGQQPEGQQPEGEQPEGQQPEGQQPEGQQPEGEQPEQGGLPLRGAPNPLALPAVEEIRVGTPELVPSATVGDTITFDAAGFSVYMIVATVIERVLETSDGRTYKITVTCDAASGIRGNAELS